jgi:hypothetical protein
MAELSREARALLLLLDHALPLLNELVTQGYVRALSDGTLERTQTPRATPKPPPASRAVLSIDEIWERHMSRARLVTEAAGDTMTGDPIPLPPDWIPSRNAALLARDLGLNLAEEVAEFRRLHVHKGTVRTRWHQSFAWWLYSAAKQAAVDEAQVPLALGTPTNRT